ANEEATDAAAFDEAVTEIAADPAGLAARLFSTRAAGLLGERTAAQARGRISGLLVGLEVAAMRQQLDGAAVTLIGENALSGWYSRALSLLSAADARVLDAERCTIAGLAAAKRVLAG